jgi:hypothetical protein
MHFEPYTNWPDPQARIKTLPKPNKLLNYNMDGPLARRRLQVDGQDPPRTERKRRRRYRLDDFNRENNLRQRNNKSVNEDACRPRERAQIIQQRLKPPT